MLTYKLTYQEYFGVVYSSLMSAREYDELMKQHTKTIEVEVPDDTADAAVIAQAEKFIAETASANYERYGTRHPHKPLSLEKVVKTW